MKKGIRRILTVLFALCLLGIFTAAGMNLAVVKAAEDRIRTEEDVLAGEWDCVLVLGAGVRADGSPSDMLRDRVQVGLELYHRQAAPKLLMSGDHGRKGYDEVGCMLSLALEDGVPAADVFLDHAGFSTYESLVRAKEVFGAERIVIVTQKYHLYRALYIAGKLGLDAVGVPADLHTYGGQSMRDVREVAARAKDVLAVWLGAEPTYLGEAIPLSGDGRVTQEQPD